MTLVFITIKKGRILIIKMMNLERFQNFNSNFNHYLSFINLNYRFFRD